MKNRDVAGIKLLYLALRNISQRWMMPIQNWRQAMSQLMIRFEIEFDPASQKIKKHKIQYRTRFVCCRKFRK